MAGNNGFVAGIGSTNVDLLYSGLERLPNEGEEIYSKNFSIQLGGGIPATMINLGRLGINSKIATELGDDLFSSFAKSQFEKNGVTPLNLYKGSGIPLNVTSAMITKSDRTFMSFGKQRDVTEEMKNSAYEMCKGAKIAEMQVGEYFPVYKKLKEDGATIVFDCGFDENMTLKTYMPYIELADYYTPNRKEAMMITDTKTPMEAAKVLSKYFKKVVVKLDSEGCIGMENGQSFIVPSIPEFKLEDSTGAGDAFLAGFIYGIYHSLPLYDSILLGNITGGKCITKVGCLAAEMDEDWLISMYEKYKRK